MRWTNCCALLLMLATPAVSQEPVAPPDPEAPVGENLKTPPDWRVRLDKADSEVVIGDEEGVDIWFVSMVPGWHITTGPRAIFWHPGLAAEGNWRAESKIHLFDPEGRNEAFGVFFGGNDLESDGISYDYFVLRNKGEFLIKRRRGTETIVIRDWTPHEAIVTFAADSGSSVPNVLTVEAGEENVEFGVNGAVVATVPRAEVATDGLIGLRVNHHLNLHVSSLSVTPADQ